MWCLPRGTYDTNAKHGTVGVHIGILTAVPCLGVNLRSEQGTLGTQRAHCVCKGARAVLLDD